MEAKTRYALAVVFVLSSVVAVSAQAQDNRKVLPTINVTSSRLDDGIVGAYNARPRGPASLPRDAPGQEFAAGRNHGLRMRAHQTIPTAGHRDRAFGGIPDRQAGHLEDGGFFLNSP